MKISCPCCGSTDLKADEWIDEEGRSAPPGGDDVVPALECQECWTAGPRMAWEKRQMAA